MCGMNWELRLDGTMGVIEKKGIVYLNNTSVVGDNWTESIEDWIEIIISHEFTHLLLYRMEGELASHSLDNIEWN